MRRLPTADGHDLLHGVSEQSLPGLRDERVLGKRRIVPLFPPPALPQVRNEMPRGMSILVGKFMWLI